MKNQVDVWECGGQGAPRHPQVGKGERLRLGRDHLQQRRHQRPPRRPSGMCVECTAAAKSAAIQMPPQHTFNRYILEEQARRLFTNEMLLYVHSALGVYVGQGKRFSFDPLAHIYPPSALDAR